MSFFTLKTRTYIMDTKWFKCSSFKILLGGKNYNKSHKKSNSDFLPQFDRIQYPQLVVILLSRTARSLTGWSTHNPSGNVDIFMLCEFASIRSGVTDTSLLQRHDTASLVTRLSTFRDYCQLTLDMISNCRRIKSTCPG